MITAPVTDLKSGDVVRFTGRNGNTYELADDPQPHAFEHGLIVLPLRGAMSTLTVPKNIELAVVKMVRTVTVRCLASGGHDVRVLVDLAVSPKPRAVLCGDCDERITAKVMAAMAAEETEVKDATGEKDFSA